MPRYAVCRDMLYAEICCMPRYAVCRDMLYAEICCMPRRKHVRVTVGQGSTVPGDYFELNKSGDNFSGISGVEVMLA